MEHFRLNTGHNCMAEYFNSIGIFLSNICRKCNVGVTNAKHILTLLDQESEICGEIGKIYWNVRTYVNSLLSNSTPLFL